MLHKRLSVVAAAALLAASAVSPAAVAADHASSDQAKTLVADAVAYLKAKGPDEATKAFQDPKGNFRRGELYVFVFDTNGRYVASGANPRLAGSDAANLKDAEGKPIVQAMITETREKPDAVIDYVWLNRQTNKVEHKHSYVTRDGNYIVGAGTYDD
ncbi:cache domain-containing protein [Azospirillum picis]|uniref:Cytochrome c n=1 Tax=Azospirillum picis TaxID=488438 RepID=A0ABU0MH10_9PROT|nr:cache domain-containing protein [Azospirillum picis]MBP2299013.1 cytochrome c [Azospirillum picis]MDQ0532745.1 cytochrome c [Azospirillum picis]